MILQNILRRVVGSIIIEISLEIIFHACFYQKDNIKIARLILAAASIIGLKILCPRGLAWPSIVSSRVMVVPSLYHRAIWV